MSRIYLQVLEVKSLEVIYRQAYWRYFTSGRETPPNAIGGVFIGGIGPPPMGRLKLRKTAPVNHLVFIELNLESDSIRFNLWQTSYEGLRRCMTSWEEVGMNQGVY